MKRKEGLAEQINKEQSLWAVIGEGEQVKTECERELMNLLAYESSEKDSSRLIVKLYKRLIRFQRHYINTVDELTQKELTSRKRIKNPYAYHWGDRWYRFVKKLDKYGDSWWRTGLPLDIEADGTEIRVIRDGKWETKKIKKGYYRIRYHGDDVCYEWNSTPDDIAPAFSIYISDFPNGSIYDFQLNHYCPYLQRAVQERERKERSDRLAGRILEKVACHIDGLVARQFWLHEYPIIVESDRQQRGKS